MIVCNVCNGSKTVRNGAEMRICPKCKGEGRFLDKDEVTVGELEINDESYFEVNSFLRTKGY